MLAGDIGSGKTTILLSIEFAIFGLMKGIVSGSMLLRHGAASGSVELTLEIDKKPVTITRSLKRKGDNIQQDTGTLTIGDSTFEGTPQELKSRILSLLGYPESLLNKSKSLIFRYTVFTPQEDMKKILYESKDERLDILRRLFNIDKYKRIKENTLGLTKEIRSQISFLEGKLEALPTKKKEASILKATIVSLKDELKSAGKKLEDARAAALKKANEVRSLEAEFEKARVAERELGVKKAELALITSNSSKLEAERQTLKVEVDSLISELQGFDPSSAKAMAEKLELKRIELNKLSRQLDEIHSKTAEFSTKKDAAEEILKQVTGLNECPTCLQKVSPEHMEDVKIKQNSIIHACGANLVKLSEFQKKFLEKKNLAQAEIDNYLKGEKEFERFSFKIKYLDEKKRRKELIENEQSLLLEKTRSLRAVIERLSAAWEQEKGKKELISKARAELDMLISRRSSCESLNSGITAKLEVNNMALKQLEADLSSLKEDESSLHKAKEKKSWLETDFIALVDSIEASVLSRIYSEFSSFFEQWFSTLIEDESISASLDDSFTPVITQNGYETSIDNLSGGEKTSVALAYRLALNKVINDFMSSVNTRDVIILDEPTEGFSSDQLDRVRDVLNQTKVAQTIIVSHEAKMEGFVDSIIRIRKAGHESKAA